MTELDQVWSQMLVDATRNAAASGQHAVADFLRLKATNDAIRSTGVRWLFDAFIEMAGEAVRTRAALTMEREEPHNFADGSSNMVGSRLLIRHGVRCLTVEAGWTRTPGDGIMRGGALALARISHFGMPRHTDEFKLIHGDDLPIWITAAGTPAGTADLRRHFNLFLET